MTQLSSDDSSVLRSLHEGHAKETEHPVLEAEEAEVRIELFGHFSLLILTILPIDRNFT